MASQLHAVNSLRTLSYNAIFETEEPPVDSLEKLCFMAIVENFEMFYLAFTLTYDFELCRKFKFLQRIYSYNLLSHLHEEGLMTEEYLNFLINEHLEHFNVEWVASFPVYWENVFSRLTRLISLNFLDQCNDDILKIVAKYCHKLEEIYLKYSPVTDIGIRYLCRDESGSNPCPNLRKIYIQSTGVTQRGIEYLIQNQPSLQFIDEPKVPLLLYSLHKNDLINIERTNGYKLLKMRTLKFKKLPYYTDLLRICLILCPKMDTLTCQISDTAELDLIRSTDLKHLRLEYLGNDSKINIDNFLNSKGRNINYLRISNCELSYVELALYCPALKRLYASDCVFKVRYNRRPTFQCLEKFTVEKFKSDSPTDRAITLFLLDSPQLISISFRNGFLAFSVRHFILKWCDTVSINKKVIYFKGLELERNFVKGILSACPPLHAVCLDGCSFDNSDLEPLYRLPNVRTLLTCLSVNDRTINEVFSDSGDEPDVHPESP